MGTPPFRPAFLGSRRMSGSEFDLTADPPGYVHPQVRRDPLPVIRLVVPREHIVAINWRAQQCERIADFRLVSF